MLPKGYPMRLTKANVAKLSLPEGYTAQGPTELGAGNHTIIARK